jgi:hypothetical protein
MIGNQGKKTIQTLTAILDHFQAFVAIYSHLEPFGAIQSEWQSSSFIPNHSQLS